jgi:hypothetical protein
MRTRHFRFLFRTAGGHTHVRIFAGLCPQSLGLCGTLCLSNDEWALYKGHTIQGFMALGNVEVFQDWWPPAD